MPPEAIETVASAEKAAQDQWHSPDPAQLSRCPVRTGEENLRTMDRKRNMNSGKLRMDLELFLGTARLEQRALHGSFTGLFNRLMFERRWQQEVWNAMARNSTFTVFMIDLDRFKQLNDVFGRSAGIKFRIGIRTPSFIRRSLHPPSVARASGGRFLSLNPRLRSELLP